MIIQTTETIFSANSWHSWMKKLFLEWIVFVNYEVMNMLSQMMAFKESPRSLEINNDNLNINSPADVVRQITSISIEPGVDIEVIIVDL